MPFDSRGRLDPGAIVGGELASSFCILHARRIHIAYRMFAAVQQLGLKLAPVKGSVEVLVIDSAVMPSEN